MLLGKGKIIRREVMRIKSLVGTTVIGQSSVATRRNGQVERLKIAEHVVRHLRIDIDRCRDLVDRHFTTDRHQLGRLIGKKRVGSLDRIVGAVKIH